LSQSARLPYTTVIVQAQTSPPKSLKRKFRRSDLSAVRWYAAMPILAMLAFVGVMVAFYWYLERTEQQQLRQMLYRDIEWSQQNLKLRWRDNQDAVFGLTETWTQLSNTGAVVRPNIASFLGDNPDVLYVYWLNPDRRIQWLQSNRGITPPENRPFGVTIEDSAAFAAFNDAHESNKVQYSPPFVGADNDTLIEMHVPVYKEKLFYGTVSVAYSLTRSLRQSISADMKTRYKIDLADQGGSVLVSTSTRTIHDANLSYELPLDPPGHGIRLRAFAFETRPLLIDRILLATVLGLSLLIAASLALLWRFAWQKMNAEAELASETSFRRAMEDSISTGMRVIDLRGKITYVNRAFCIMMGFDENELVGVSEPYPYWPKEQLPIHKENLRQLLDGALPPSGLRTEVQRKDGTRFFARMYVSALVNQDGTQTGWMTSMTDITEPERIREDLRAAHEQFTTVMEQLDAAVCVTSEKNILFTNHMYRQAFGEKIHPELTAVANMAQHDDEAVVQVAMDDDRWFEIRSRKIRWVDGSSAQLTIATDTTQRRAAAEVQQQEQERLARTSRLITMGEMASSLAHELNQPLTAIANYTMGGASRIRSAEQRNEPIPAEELANMLEKTARQAERAGQVVRRIREFVKRSEPDRRACTAQSIVDDAVGLAEIDARRTQTMVTVYVDQGLPELFADPILIEQVLLNLIKNGIEAMQQVTTRELVVTVRHRDESVQFSVIDKGCGIAPAQRAKLFEPFYTTKTEGMGMGLNICRSIIEFHQGRLWIEDNPTGGCVFRFSLPTSLKLHNSDNAPLTESTANLATQT
jgi:PAS domain S-box-containing protein